MPQLPSVSEIKRLWGRCLHVAAIVALLAASCVCVWLGLTQARVVGTHGTLTVEYCYANHHVTTKRRYSSPPPDDYTCNGTFRSDDGKVLSDNAHLSVGTTTYPKGHTFPATRTGADVMRDDHRAVTTTFLLAFGLLLLDAFVLFWFLTQFDKNGKTLKDTWHTTKGTPTRTVVVSIAAVALTGLAASPLLDLALTG
ncbi:hypothetical protein AB0D04_18960 [Streptomyces sp. NPDC048483]|uniref:hypothetical protein n=1 Tax=Streptomyces sp. NPDC048483 TaxID=3154927 RepID=UPI0034284824